jgi:hypothetical protein
MKEKNIKFKILLLLIILFGFFGLAKSSQAVTFFQEDFEDANFTARNWYDTTANSNLITASQYKTGTHAYECHYANGTTACANGTPARHLFTASDSVYVSYWMKLSSNWAGSGQPYHPHIIMLLTDQNGVWDGPAITHTTGYLELNANKPRIGLQDGQNIDNNNRGANLCDTSESRAANGCNGTCDSDPWDDPAGCYDLTGNGDWTNGKMYTPNTALTLNVWHHTEAYMQMNTISGGKGQKDGIMQMWIDGSQVMNFTDIIYRTNQYPTMKWNQFFIGPYIGDGSPANQYFWMDDLMVASARVGGDITPPAAPTGLSVN